MKTPGDNVVGVSSCSGLIEKKNLIRVYLRGLVRFPIRRPEASVPTARREAGSVTWNVDQTGEPWPHG